VVDQFDNAGMVMKGRYIKYPIQKKYKKSSAQLRCLM